MTVKPPARLSLILILALAGLTGACAGNNVEMPLAAGASASPAPVPGYDWHLTTAEGEVRLAYGVADSDDLKLGLTCVDGSRKVEIMAPAPTGSREIHLESGGDTMRLVARSEPSGLHDGDFLSASADADQPVFQRFRRLGWVAQWRDGRREIYASHPGSGPGVESFFRRCG